MKQNKNIKNFIIILIGLVILNIAGSYLYKRFDLTQDKRYTLSNAAKTTISTVDSPIIIDVFLKGNFPPEFKKLQVDTIQM
jgi:ABC-2 type transport system permease protein